MLTILARSRVDLQMKELKNRTGNGRGRTGGYYNERTKYVQTSACYARSKEDGMEGTACVRRCVDTSHIEGTMCMFAYI
jgi:hypothetical protein